MSRDGGEVHAPLFQLQGEAVVSMCTVVNAAQRRLSVVICSPKLLMILYFKFVAEFVAARNAGTYGSCRMKPPPYVQYKIERKAQSNVQHLLRKFSSFPYSWTHNCCPEWRQSAYRSLLHKGASQTASQLRQRASQPRSAVLTPQAIPWSKNRTIFSFLHRSWMAYLLSPHSAWICAMFGQQDSTATGQSAPSLVPVLISIASGGSPTRGSISSLYWRQNPHEEFCIAYSSRRASNESLRSMLDAVSGQ